MNIFDKKFFVYVLELEDGKYYVGRTENACVRIEDHFLERGSSFTKKHKPIRVVEVYKNCDRFDEQKYVYMYMHEHGIDNVRGGSHSNAFLTKSERDHIQNVVRNATDACFKCGKNGHFSSNCPKTSDIIEISDDDDGNDYESEDEVMYCMRCGRNSHVVNTCRAKTHINGSRLK